MSGEWFHSIIVEWGVPGEGKTPLSLVGLFSSELFIFREKMEMESK